MKSIQTPEQAKAKFIAEMMEINPEKNTLEVAERMWECAGEIVLAGNERRATAEAARVERESRKVKDLSPLTGMRVRFCRNKPPARIKSRGGLEGKRYLYQTLPGVPSSKKVWDVPATGGYVGGWETGMALAFLFYKRAKTVDRASGWNFLEIVRSIAASAEPHGGLAVVLGNAKLTPEQDSMRGQVCGFLTAIGDWASCAALYMKGPADDLSEAQLIGMANRGLAYDSAAAHAEMLAEDERTEAEWEQERRAATTEKRRALREARKAAAQAAPIVEYVEPERLAA